MDEPSNQEQVQLITAALGRALGLTDIEIFEVANAWAAWYQQRHWIEPDFARIWQALTDRAAGGEWRP